MAAFHSKLTIDPGGSALVRTMAYPIFADWPEETVSAQRQDFAGLDNGWARGVSRPALSRPGGTLRLLLSLADRQWLHFYAARIFQDGDTLRVQPDYNVPGEWTDVVVAGDDVPETYDRLFPDRLDTDWFLTLPVIVVDES
jgi:hypothetical protein